MGRRNLLQKVGSIVYNRNWNSQGSRRVFVNKGPTSTCASALTRDATDEDSRRMIGFYCLRKVTSHWLEEQESSVKSSKDRML